MALKIPSKQNINAPIYQIFSFKFTVKSPSRASGGSAPEPRMVFGHFISSSPQVLVCYRAFYRHKWRIGTAKDDDALSNTRNIFLFKL